MSKETESLRYINCLCDEMRKHAQDLLKIFAYYEKAKAVSNPAEQDKARWEVACGLEHWGMVHKHCYKERWDNAIPHIYIRIIEPWIIDDVPSFEERKVRLNMVKVLMDKRWNDIELDEFTELIDRLADNKYIKDFYDWFSKLPRVKPDSFLSAKNLREMKDWLSNVRLWQIIIRDIVSKAEQIVNPTYPHVASITAIPPEQTQALKDIPEEIRKHFNKRYGEKNWRKAEQQGWIIPTGDGYDWTYCKDNGREKPSRLAYFCYKTFIGTGVAEAIKKYFNISSNMSSLISRANDYNGTNAYTKEWHVEMDDILLGDR